MFFWTSVNGIITTTPSLGDDLKFQDPVNIGTDPRLANIFSGVSSYQSLLATEATTAMTNLGTLELTVQPNSNNGLNSVQTYYYPFSTVVTDNIATNVFTNTNLKKLDTSGYFTDGVYLSNETFTIQIPTTLRNGYDGYYVRLCAKDQAGNYSPVMTSNIINLDTNPPEQPSVNYFDHLKLNQNRFDIDFADQESGLYNVQFWFNDAGRPDLAVNPLWDNVSQSISITVNGIPVTYYPKYLTKNWKMPTDTWNSIPRGVEQTLMFKLTDAVGNTVYDYTGLHFTVDDVPLNVMPNFDYSLPINNQNFTDRPTGSINFAPNEQPFTIAVVKNMPIGNIISSNGEICLFTGFLVLKNKVI